MPIEFNCPYCAAMIRVPDNARGGKGKCPRCAKRITVPRSSTKPVAPPPQVEEVQVFPSSPSDQLAEPSDPNEVQFATAGPDLVEPEPGDIFTGKPQAPVRSSPSAFWSKAREGQLKRQQNSSMLLMGSVAFGLVVCGIMGWLLWQQNQSQRMAGELAAQHAVEVDLPAAELSGAYFKQSSEELQATLEDLAAGPVRISSSYGTTSAKIQFSATKRAVTILLSAGPTTSFYRVDPKDDAGFASFRKKYKLDLEQQLSDELEVSATQFAEEYRRVKEKKSEGKVMNGFLNTLALPALAKGVGRELTAVHQNAAYPCVYEDRDGAFYFLLPPKVTEFEIVGRKRDDGSVLFPGKYLVKVTGELTPPPAEEPTEKDPKAKSKDDDDMKDNDDSEMKSEKDDKSK